jgi:hypothetical protein
MTEPMLQFFERKELPESLREVAEDFHNMAQVIVETLPRNPERTVALRKLLEASDAALRAKLWRET